MTPSAIAKTDTRAYTTHNVQHTMKQRQGTATPNRAQGVSAHRSGDSLEAWGGIISAHLDDWADELNATAEDILGAVDSAGIDPVTDTAEPKGQSKDRDRPTDPALRCLALTTGDAQTLKNILSQ